MRFSIRWLLVVTAYLALLAAAIGTTNVLLDHMLWGATILIVCYAFVVGIIDRGRRQAMTIGFAVVSGAYLCALHAAPSKVPAMWLYRVAGYRVQTRDSGDLYLMSDAPPGATLAGTPLRFVTVQPAISLSTANAVTTLIAGFVGCWIGGLAYKRRSEGD